MTKLLMTGAVLFTLAAAPAFAATAPAAPAPARPTATAANPKLAACQAQWRSQRHHTQTRKAFLAACLKA